jgi:methylase of polypeptide subunit release factors
VKPAGILLLEHGVDQQQDVARILQAEGWIGIECLRESSGRPRVTRARAPLR